MSAAAELLRELAMLEPEGGTLSVYARTDPRDPANTAHVPAWVVALRNGLRAVGRRLEDGAPRAQSLAVRGLAERVEAELLELDPAERARGVAWFVTPGRGLDRRLSLQIGPRADLVRWDERPFISPLVETADRGRATGLVLVAGDRVRLLHWEDGRVHEPERSLYELELGDWREYAAYAVANPARAQQTATHTASFEQRVGEWRRRFLHDAAAATAARVGELGWERLLVAAEGQVAHLFAEALPAHARDLVAAEVEMNLLSEDPAAVADRLAEELEGAWRRELLARAARAIGAARPGGLGVAGFAPTLEALVQYRVQWLVLDVQHPFGGPDSESRAERAARLAIGGGAEVSVVPPGSSAALTDAGGIAAALRY